MLKQFIIIVAVCLLVACKTTTPVSLERTQAVQAGMTNKQVIESLGRSPYMAKAALVKETRYLVFYYKLAVAHREHMDMTCSLGRCRPTRVRVPVTRPVLYIFKHRAGQYELIKWGTAEAIRHSTTNPETLKILAALPAK